MIEITLQDRSFRALNGAQYMITEAG